MLQGAQRLVFTCLLLVAVVHSARAASGALQLPYHPSDHSLSAQTILLTGQDLTVEQVVAVARHGARIALSDKARQRSADAYGLLLEATAEGVPVYWFNRGSGAGREVAIFNGDALSPENKAMLEARQLEIFRRGATAGVGPEILDEDIVRAMLVVRANTMTYEAASPSLTQALLDIINAGITPVVRSRSTVGEGDLGPFTNVCATLVGAGDAYYHGVRMSAEKALKSTGLKPLAPFAADDSALISTNSYASAQAALLVFDARQALGWADLAYGIDLNGMNSSVTPLSAPVQENRPFPWLNWHAARMLSMIKGSYLYYDDPTRIIQDAESLRASSIRQASAWQAWDRLRSTVQLQINSSDHNPAVRVGAAPTDSWELNTPQLLKFYVRGGPHSNGKHGYILSNANWDPYPLVNDIEAFTIALANMDVAIGQRIGRFTSPFFTGISAAAEKVGEPGRWGASQGSALAASALMQEIQGLAVPVPPEGTALILNVEDLQSQSRLKVSRARLAVSNTEDLIAEDLLTGTYWLDLRRLQTPERMFGIAVTGVWKGLRTVVPFDDGDVLSQTESIHDRAVGFIRAHEPTSFYPDSDSAPMPSVH
jgi:histidine ammonia-lyase